MTKQKTLISNQSTREKNALAAKNRLLAGEHATLLAKKEVVIKRLFTENEKLSAQKSVEKQEGGYFQAIMQYFLGREKPNSEKMTDFCKLCAHIMDRNFSYEPGAFPASFFPGTAIVIRTAHYQEKRAPLLILKDSADPEQQKILAAMCHTFFSKLEQASTGASSDKERKLSSSILKEINLYRSTAGCAMSSPTDEKAAYASAAVSSEKTEKSRVTSSLFAPAPAAAMTQVGERSGAFSAAQTPEPHVIQDENYECRKANIGLREALVLAINEQQPLPSYTNIQTIPMNVYGIYRLDLVQAVKECEDDLAKIIVDNRKLELERLSTLIERDQQIQGLEDVRRSLTEQLLAKPTTEKKAMDVLRAEHRDLKNENTLLFTLHHAHNAPPAYSPAALVPS